MQRKVRRSYTMWLMLCPLGMAMLQNSGFVIRPDGDQGDPLFHIESDEELMVLLLFLVVLFVVVPGVLFWWWMRAGDRDRGASRGP